MDNKENAIEQYKQEIEKLKGEIEALRLSNSENTDNLKSINEELIVSNEELNSLNDRYIAQNEELQSANEELQSANEELEITNAELAKTFSDLKVMYEKNRLQHSEIIRIGNELKKHDDLLLQILNSSPNGIMAFESLRNHDGKIVDFTWTMVNKKAESLLGNKEIFFIGKKLLEIMPASKNEGLFDKYVYVTETGDMVEFEHFYEHEGIKEWFRTVALKCGDGFVATFETITEAKNRELQLKVAEERLRLATQAANIGVWDWDLITDKIICNDEMYELYGFKKESTKEFHKEWTKPIHEDDIQGVHERISDAISGKSREFKASFRAWKSKDEITYLYSHGIVLPDDEGNPMRMVGVNLDETEQVNQKEFLEKRIIQEVLKRREQDELLIQQNKLASMGEMIGMIAHQWRQPLNALSIAVGSIDLILDEYDRDAEIKKEKILEKIERSFELITQMNDTINDFRNFFKKDYMIVEHFGIEQVFREVLSLLSGQLETININVIMSIDEAFSLEGVKNQFKHVALNIVLNAKDAIVKKREILDVTNGDYRGEIQITAKKGKGYFDIFISDNGIGIHDDIKDRLFEPYFTTKHANNGTGVGLYMSKTIIERYFGGVITLSNNINGNGTQCHIRAKR